MVTGCNRYIGGNPGLMVSYCCLPESAHEPEPASSHPPAPDAQQAAREEGPTRDLSESVQVAARILGYGSLDEPIPDDVMEAAADIEEYVTRVEAAAHAEHAKLRERAEAANARAQTYVDSMTLERTAHASLLAAAKEAQRKVAHIPFPGTTWVGPTADYYERGWQAGRAAAASELEAALSKVIP
jgi:hypothetical protein